MTSLVSRIFPIDRLDLPLVLFLGSMLLTPFYIFPSGTPQPGDFVKLAAVGLLLVGNKMQLSLPRQLREVTLALGLFVLWTALVSGVWFLLAQDMILLRAPVFYLFNLIMFLGTIMLGARYGSGALLCVSNMAGICIGFLLLLGFWTYDSRLPRQFFTFNNPNQLGYYAVLTVSMFFAVPSHSRRPFWIQALVLLGATVSVLLSASRAGAAALLPIYLLVGLRRRDGVPVLASAAIGAWIYTTYFQAQGVEAGTQRITTKTHAGERGYDRLFNHLEQILLGGGEGAVWRWDTALDAEMHSTPGTLLFSYGIIGLALFAWALLSLVRRLGPTGLLWFSPPLLYGLTHQGLRFTEFWIFLAVVGLNTVFRHVPASPQGVAVPKPLVLPHKSA